MKKRYNKLVRDNIPNIIKANGGKAVTRTLSGKEYLAELVKKLGEEASEFTADFSAEELADVLEVVYALREAIGITSEGLEVVRTAKAAKNGAFKQKIFLESVEG